MHTDFEFIFKSPINLAKFTTLSAGTLSLKDKTQVLNGLDNQDQRTFPKVWVGNFEIKCFYLFVIQTFIS